ncbi:GGDEF domain-containing protein [Campylobacter hyointestinalis]|uniref:diguanylate cyclase n=1 Tax=Campylobacter hyointestinalis subsp. hyointestinalis TaxID=91352 RepID=A0A855NBE8_CAMHY|nr:GGDEF domain-containing protein [Campylobacter hyointestinalis]PPB59478.1 GGDEF domain-containing protein [Campylobacter hyointestinalis subsp. hyointestinalis]PPB64315.1 GGDEF domain-containing protein [Campylobacter hyointestinalis subsp. hyointestinalis]PPB71877.1 GGDEF domain-containing protein [Campylobacter hyointestinalis subsp. hyointestinalis]SUW88342.1 diguanylate cyclase [Campylobacter hyointestinalis]
MKYTESTLFVWNKDFETNIPLVDEEHVHLVELINELILKISNQEALEIADISSVFNKLFDYAKYHFGDEERIMIESKLYPDFIREHAYNHKMFLQEVETLYNEFLDSKDYKKNLKDMIDFLINWLAFHILGQDKKMAKQIELMNQGYSAKQAFEMVDQIHESNETQPLVNALNNMLNTLSRRNKELLSLKKNLEQKVEERTTELMEANRHLEYLSTTDQLTELKNRRYAMDALNMLWHSTCKFTDSIAVLMIDLDHFKEVNDNYGHDCGDIVLKTVAVTLKDSVRNDDIVCRLGGDEFLIICPHTFLQGAIKVANNILKEIKKLNVSIDGGFWSGSASIGVASSDPKMQGVEDLIKRADDQVYKAKEAGKNCVKF